jgi:hypothetical protein
MGAVFLNDDAGNTYRFNTAGPQPNERETAAMQRKIAEVNAKIPKPPPPPETGLGISALNFGKGTLRGLGSLGGDVLRTAGGIGDYLSGAEEPGLLSRTGKDIDSGLANIFGPSPGYEDSLSYGAGNMAGMLGGFLIPGTLVAKASRGAVLAGEAGLGAAVGGGEAQRRMDAYEEAKGVTLDPETRIVSNLLGMTLGTTFAVPINLIAKPLAQLLRFVPKSSASTAAQTIAERLKDTAITGGVAGAQNVIYGVGQDLVEKGLYNPDIDPTDSIMSDLTIGGGVGALMHFAFGRAYNKRLTSDKELYGDLKAQGDLAAELPGKRAEEEALQRDTFAAQRDQRLGADIQAEAGRQTAEQAAAAATQRMRDLGKPGLNESRRPYVEPLNDGWFQARDEFDRPIGQKAKSIDSVTSQIDRHVSSRKAAVETAKVDPNEPLTHAERMRPLERQLADTLAEKAQVEKEIKGVRKTRRKVVLGPEFDARIARTQDSIARLNEERAREVVEPEILSSLELSFKNKVGENFTTADVLEKVKKNRLRSSDPNVDAPITQRELAEVYKEFRPTSTNPERFATSVLEGAEKKRKLDYLAKKEAETRVREPEATPEPIVEAKPEPASDVGVVKRATPLETISGVDVPKVERAEINVGDRVRTATGAENVVVAKDASGDIKLKNAIVHIPQNSVERIEPVKPATPEAPKPEPVKAPDLEDLGLKSDDVAMLDKLQQRLHGYGLKSVALKLRRWLDSTTDAGSLEREGHIPKIIELATGVYRKGMSDDDLLQALGRVMDHEVFHAIRNVLDANEIRTLENFVLKTKMPDKTYTYVQYHQAKAEGKSREHILEEAMADAFRDWSSGDLKISGQPRTVMAHIFSMFKRIGEWWTSSPGARDVFEKIKSGEIAKRIDAERKPVASEGLRAEADRLDAVATEKKFSTIGPADDLRTMYSNESDPERRRSILYDSVWHDLNIVRDKGGQLRFHYDQLKTKQQMVLEYAANSPDGNPPTGMVDELKSVADSTARLVREVTEGPIDIMPVGDDLTPQFMTLKKKYVGILNDVTAGMSAKSVGTILRETDDALLRIRQQYIASLTPPPIVSKPKFTVIEGDKGKDPEKKFSTIGPDGTYASAPEEGKPATFKLTLGMRVAASHDPITRIRSLEHASLYYGVEKFLSKAYEFKETLRSKLLGSAPDYAYARESAERHATRLVAVFADRMVSLAKMIDMVKKRGGMVDEEWDAYILNENMAGKVNQLIRQKAAILYEPLTKSMFKMDFAKPDMDAVIAKLDANIKVVDGKPQSTNHAKTYLGHTIDANNGMLGLYLYARHAPERNAVERVMNPNGKPALDANHRPIEGKWWSSDELSGMSDKSAAEIMDFFAKHKNYSKLVETAKLADDIVKDINIMRAEVGLIPQEFKYDPEKGYGKVFKDAGVYADDAKTQLGYKHWTPLRGFAEDPDFTGMEPVHGRGFQTLSREDPRAMGRGSMAAKIVENILAISERAVQRSERAKVGQAFLEMVQRNEDQLKGLAEIVEFAPLKWTLEDGNFRVIGRTATGEKTLETKTGLHGRLRVDPFYKMAEDNEYFTIKSTGKKAEDLDEKGNPKQYTIRVFDPGVARALKGEIGIKSEVAQSIINNIGKVTRFLANLATSWNPEFLFMNMQRDILAAGINLKQFEIEGLSTEMMKRIAPSLKTLYMMTPETRLGYVSKAEGRTFTRADAEKLPEAQRKLANLALDFFEDGGSVEFQGIKELADITSHINDQLRDPANFTTLEKSKAMFGRFGDFIEGYNKIVENGTRLSVYGALREALVKNGMDAVKARLHAARAAKNMTANFNRGGELKPLINALYMFYNASIQGTFGMLTAARNSGKVRAMLGTIFLAGAAQDAMMSMISPEDENGEKVYDNIQEWALRKRMIFIDPFGIIPKGYLALPMPYGFNAIYNFGRSTMKGARGGSSPGEAAGSAFGEIIDVFNPVGGSNSFMNFVAPTVLDPFVDLSLNTDYKRDPIAKTPSGYGVQAPQSQLHWNNTSPTSVKIAEWLNEITGGDVGISGAVDISSDQLDYIASYLTGGAGRFIGRLATGAEKALTGNLDDLTTTDVPVLRAFVGGVSDRSTVEQYIEARQEVLQPAKAIKDASDNGDIKSANALRRQYADKVKLMGVFQAVDSARNKLSTQLRHIQRNVNIPDDRKEVLVKRLRDLIADQENRALRAYNSE